MTPRFLKISIIQKTASIYNKIYRIWARVPELAYQIQLTEILLYEDGQ